MKAIAILRFLLALVLVLALSPLYLLGYASRVALTLFLRGFHHAR